MTDTLTRALRAADQGVNLGADGMGWSPDPTLYRQAADEIDRLTAALAAASAPWVPAGWKLVPVEPTEDMRFAAELSKARGYADLYRAMLAASPPPPTEQARQPLTQRQIDGILNASREADEGPSQLIRRAESALGVGEARRPLTDAPVCPWCDRQGHDICQHADDARTCHQ